MSDWRRAIRQAVERDEQDHLSVDEARAMRRIVVAAVSDGTPSRASSPWGRRSVLVAATIVAVISAAIGTGLHVDLTNRQPSTTQLVPNAAPIDTTNTAYVTTPTRQLQFVTAGGTRIIWVFNSDLNLEANSR